MNNHGDGIGTWKQRVWCGFHDLWPSEILCGEIWPFLWAFDGTTLTIARATHPSLACKIRAAFARYRD